MEKQQVRLSQEPIYISSQGNGYLKVHLPYTPDRVLKIKSIPGRRWDPDIKCWTVPHTEGIVESLLILFEGERIQVERSLRNPGDFSRIPAAKPVGHLIKMAQELRLQGYRAKTRKSYLGHAERYFRCYEIDTESLGEDEVRQYVYDLLEKGASHSYVNQCVSALKFLYRGHRSQSKSNPYSAGQEKEGPLYHAFQSCAGGVTSICQEIPTQALAFPGFPSRAAPPRAFGPKDIPTGICEGRNREDCVGAYLAAFLRYSFA